LLIKINNGVADQKNAFADQNNNFADHFTNSRKKSWEFHHIVKLKTIQHSVGKPQKCPRKIHLLMTWKNQ
jgi:hypothetical protein